MNLGDALAWLDRHQNLERILADSRLHAPEPERMRRLAHVIGDPQASQPIIHLTGTNGKTSAARALSQLLISKGINVGTFISPHLQRLNERIMVGLQPISDVDLAEVLSDLAGLEDLLGDQMRPTWFELLAAAAFRYFADRPVDVAVVEVGMGGRWDATNIADGTVSIITNVELDHTELLGPTRAHIAREKAGIVKPGTTLVLGETDPELYEIFAAEAPEALWLAGRDFAVESAELAEGGRSLDLRTPEGHYDDVYLPLHGRHQADNFVDALAGAEAFFGKPLEQELVAKAAAAVTSPGRLEVVHQSPLVVLDGAKNVAGAASSAIAVNEELAEGRSRVMVVGMLRGKSPVEMLSALDVAKSRLVVTCPPPSPRAQPAEEIAEAARSLGCRAIATASVAEALEVALGEAGADELVLVTGSLYVVGAARTVLLGEPGLAPRSAEPGPASGFPAGARARYPRSLVGTEQLEGTLVICKPDAVERGLVGEIIGRLERRGLRLARAELRHLDTETAGRHYAEHVGKPFYESLIDHITRSPVLLAVVEGPVGTWQVVRNTMGATNPAQAQPGTIRGDLALSMTENLIHGSDSAESASREIALFFGSQR